MLGELVVEEYSCIRPQILEHLHAYASQFVKSIVLPLDIAPKPCAERHSWVTKLSSVC